MTIASIILYCSLFIGLPIGIALVLRDIYWAIRGKNPYINYDYKEDNNE